MQMSLISESRGLLEEAQSKSDLIMMSMLKGKERNRSQWHDLFSQSHFSLERIVPTRTPFSVIVGRPMPLWKNAMHS